MITTKCNVCNGTGYVINVINGKYKKRKCTNINCVNGEIIDIKEDLSNKKNDVKVDEDWINSHISNRYFYENEFNKMKLLKGCPMPRDLRDVKFDNYVNFLDEYLTRINMGIIDKKSYYIYAPDRFGKKHFVYTVMKRLKQQGKRPSKLFTIYDIYIYLDKAKYEELHSEINNKDLIFLDLGSNPPQIKTKVVINYLKEQSERLGIPLIIISSAEDTHVNVYAGYNTSNPCSDRTKEGELGRIERKGISKESRDAYNKKFNSFIPIKNNYSKNNKGKEEVSPEFKDDINLNDLDDIQKRRRK